MADDGNLSAEQNEKLAQFQEITSIESTDECKQLLEAFEWNIESAIQNTLNDQHVHQPTTSTSSSMLNMNQSLSSSTSSLASNQTAGASSLSAAFSAALGTVNRAQANANNDLFSMSANDFPPPPPVPAQPPLIRSQQASPFARNRTSPSSQNLPSIAIESQHTLTFHRPNEGFVVNVPNGFFQWSVFIVSYPFRLIFSTLLDLVSLFYSFFESPLPVDYDPLANIAEYGFYYNEKFGINHPTFYEGSYAHAVSEAKQNLKFLLVYIHHNDNKDCNTIATETLSNQTVVDFVNANFVFWSCTKNLPEGNKVFSALKARRCPFLGVIVPKNSRMTLVSRMEGPIQAENLIIQLQRIMAENEPDLVVARHEREHLAENQKLRKQQDQAYLESLKADKEKALKKQEEEEKKRKEEELKAKQLSEEKARENDIENHRRELREAIANEQEPDATNPLVIKLKFKFPNGNTFERFFEKTRPVSDMYKFVYSNEECPKRFEIVTNFPRKKIECDETANEISLLDSGVSQSMLLFITDLDA